MDQDATYARTAQQAWVIYWAARQVRAVPYCWEGVAPDYRGAWAAVAAAVLGHYAKEHSMPINETRAVSVTLEADLPAPAFIPLIDLAPDNIIIANQCILAVTGAPLPLEVAMMLCAHGTVLGTPAEEAILQVGDVFNITTDQPTALLGNVPPLAQGGVLGLHVPVALLTTGAKVEGVLSIVR